MTYHFPFLAEAEVIAHRTIGMVYAKFADLDPDHRSRGLIGPCRTLGSHQCVSLHVRLLSN